MKRFFYSILLFFLPGTVVAEEAEESLSEILFHHVMDSNIYDNIPYLPKILLPFGITVHMVMLLLSTLLILGLILPTYRKPLLKPRGVAVLFEMLVLFVRNDIVYPIMGEKRGEKWLPFFSTLFIYILVINYLGLIPAFKTATGNATVTSALAIMIMFLVFFEGIRHLGLPKFIKNYYPEGAVLPIGVFIGVLEFITTFVKGAVLSIRLFANMFAGHLAILSFLVIMFIVNPAMGLISVPFSVFTFALEVLVALIQAMVFTMLSCIFITMASSGH